MYFSRFVDVCLINYSALINIAICQQFDQIISQFMCMSLHYFSVSLCRRNVTGTFFSAKGKGWGRSGVCDYVRSCVQLALLESHDIYPTTSGPQNLLAPKS